MAQLFETLTCPYGPKKYTTSSPIPREHGVVISTRNAYVLQSNASSLREVSETNSHDLALRTGVPRGRPRRPTSSRLGWGRLLGDVIDGRNTTSAAPAWKTAARAPQSGRFLGIYAWFQSWCTSFDGPHGRMRPRQCTTPTVLRAYSHV